MIIQQIPFLMFFVSVLRQEERGEGRGEREEGRGKRGEGRGERGEAGGKGKR